jgi:hypothetical protein
MSFIYFSCRMLNTHARGKGEDCINVYPMMSGLRRFSLNLIWSQCHSSRLHPCWVELMVVAFWAMPLTFIFVVSVTYHLIVHLLHLLSNWSTILEPASGCFLTLWLRTAAMKRLARVYLAAVIYRVLGVARNRVLVGKGWKRVGGYGVS